MFRARKSRASVLTAVLCGPPARRCTLSQRCVMNRLVRRREGPRRPAWARMLGRDRSVEIYHQRAARGFTLKNVTACICMYVCVCVTPSLMNCDRGSVRHKCILCVCEWRVGFSHSSEGLYKQTGAHTDELAIITFACHCFGIFLSVKSILPTSSNVVYHHPYETNTSLSYDHTPRGRSRKITAARDSRSSCREFVCG